MPANSRWDLIQGFKGYVPLTVSDIPVTFSSICFATFLSDPIPCFNNRGHTAVDVSGPSQPFSVYLYGFHM